MSFKKISFFLIFFATISLGSDEKIRQNHDFLLQNRGFLIETERLFITPSHYEADKLFDQNIACSLTFENESVADVMDSLNQSFEVLQHIEKENKVHFLENKRIGLGNFSVLDKKTLELFGLIEFIFDSHKIINDKMIIEECVAIVQTQRSKGVGYEALKASLDFLVMPYMGQPTYVYSCQKGKFQFLPFGFGGVFAHINPGNLLSTQLHKKLGFQQNSLDKDNDFFYF